MRRTFLLLQGPATPFFAHLAARLRSEGHRVFKLNFNAGDWLYGPRSCNLNYRGKAFDLCDFLDGVYRRLEITDQVLFGDRRPVHRPAIEHGKVLGVRTHVYEEGYFRPSWVTLERQGVNSHSPLPRNPDWYWKVGGRLSETSQPIHFQ
ncbi:MAG: capsule biosynthesis protein CapA, partial [Nitrospira sp.]|nr:capsule biosynthesis protein CapA [Nitrospira sp.]